MKTAITVVPGLVAWMDPQNMALIRHIGTEMSSAELFDMLGLDRERFPDTKDTNQLQLIEMRGREKELIIQTVVACAEEKRQKPSAIDPQEYVDLLNRAVILTPCHRNDDAEWVHLQNQDKRSPDQDLPPDCSLGWFIKINTKE